MIGFVIRCVFWFSLVLLFLPIDMGERASEAEPVNPFQAIAALRDTARDVADICARQPDVCATASAAVQTITARAQEGMRITRDLLEEEQATNSEAVRPKAEVPAEDGSEPSS